MLDFITYKLLASLGTEVDDVASSRSFVDGGAFLTLPMFYLEGNCGSFLLEALLRPRHRLLIDFAWIVRS